MQLIEQLMKEEIKQKVEGCGLYGSDNRLKIINLQTKIIFLSN
jgi:hypothetical protein